MEKKMDPIEYIENIREAWHNDDELAIDKLEELYGEQPVTLKELEKAFSHSISLLMSAYQGKDIVDNAKFEILVNTLELEGVIDSNDATEIRGEIEHLENKIKGEDE